MANRRSGAHVVVRTAQSIVRRFVQQPYTLVAGPRVRRICRHRRRRSQIARPGRRRHLRNVSFFARFRGECTLLTAQGNLQHVPNLRIRHHRTYIQFCTSEKISVSYPSSYFLFLIERLNRVVIFKYYHFNL